MLDLTKKYETRNGDWEAIQITHLPDANENERLAVLMKKTGTELIENCDFYDEDGVCIHGIKGLDLVPVKKTKEAWVVLDGNESVHAYKIEETAKLDVQEFGGQYKKVTFEVEE